MNMVDDAMGVAQCLFSEAERTWAEAELLERWVRFYGASQFGRTCGSRRRDASLRTARIRPGSSRSRHERF